MPIHAAGTASVGVSDFFISSYTPTLEALLAARARPIPATSRVLAAIQPDAGDSWSALPYTKVELNEIRSVVPSDRLIPLSAGPDAAAVVDAPDLDGEMEGRYTTASAILARLPDASVLHLACHADQSPLDPLQSGFIVKDGERLTVEMLMRANTISFLKDDKVENGDGGGGIALLNACHTAANDSRYPDEAMNLANAMLFAGFRSVLATMWCVPFLLAS